MLPGSLGARVRPSFILWLLLPMLLYLYSFVFESSSFHEFRKNLDIKGIRILFFCFKFQGREIASKKRVLKSFETEILSHFILDDILSSFQLLNKVNIKFYFNAVAAFLFGWEAFLRLFLSPRSRPQLHCGFIFLLRCKLFGDDFEFKMNHITLCSARGRRRRRLTQTLRTTVAKTVSSNVPLFFFGGSVTLFFSSMFKRNGGLFLQSFYIFSGVFRYHLGFQESLPSLILFLKCG